MKIKKKLMRKFVGKVGRDSQKNFCNSSREARLKLEIYDLLPIGRLPHLKEPHTRDKIFPAYFKCFLCATSEGKLIKKR